MEKKHRNKGCDLKIVNRLFDFPNAQRDLRAKATYHLYKLLFGSFFCLLETPKSAMN